MENGAMMDHTDDADVAINLSTSQTTRSSLATPSLNTESVDNELQTSKDHLFRKTRISPEKELDGEKDASTTISPLLMMNSQFLAHHQMQQLLQQQVLSPTQLQQLLQQQQSLFMQQQQQQQQQQQVEQLESFIPQLHEQLQLNMMQQSQILNNLNSVASGDKAKSSRQQLQIQLQQLALQQHQLMQQLQLSHRYSILGLPPFLLSQGISSSDFQNLWKDEALSVEERSLKSGLNGMIHNTSTTVSNCQSSVLSILSPDHLLNGQQQKEGFRLPNSVPSSKSGFTRQQNSSCSIKEDISWSVANQLHPLFGHGVCKWPGCETVCEDQQSFILHLNKEHHLDDRSTAQARVQMQVVSQLEIQLTKEKDRLEAMMKHLHMKSPNSSSDSSKQALPPLSKPTCTSPQLSLPITSVCTSGGLFPSLTKPVPTSQLSLPSVSVSSPARLLSVALTTMANTSPLMTIPPRLIPTNSLPLHPSSHSTVGPIRRRLSDKGCPSLAVFDGTVIDSSMRRRVAEKSNLDISEEIQRNREFYKNADVRPPFTYASLIRQAIIESHEKQLTLNEIYCWFQNTFCYFRRNAATWKNAVRHNLSLHKCFRRVENVKGAVWTVDELEFYKRRPQRIQERIAGVQVGPQTTITQAPSHGYKSPTLQQNPGLCGENLTASLQAALAESNLSFLSTSKPGGTTNASTLAPTSFSLAMSKAIEDDHYLMDVVNVNMNYERPNSLTNNDVHIKQEPLLEEHTNGEDNFSDHHTSSVFHHFTEDSGHDQEGEIPVHIEEAEDLSIPANVVSDKSPTTCL
ncbi:forkhead box protein P1-like isoform X2 [Limulus polyphemus]|uniref:Forkhead box protein P1-like isoform X2 n=1 Tax=Limulus polyphemus TaxID=6850 RepID=A0ABM1SH85_LIMPO|nr:forkhead box protein P1-like isoform X2 [Limulus polyphemus]